VREVLDTLSGYLRGGISLADFQAWLLDQTWDNPDVAPVAHEIEFLIDEATTGNMTLPELRDELNAVYEAALAYA
jgi:hypothetical protein